MIRIYFYDLRSKLQYLFKAISFLAVFAIFAPHIALAKVQSSSENGFSVFHIGDVKASPEEIWTQVIRPNEWWDGKHSFSGDSDNFYLEPKINGCFCENLTTEKEDGGKQGAIQHMRIVFIDPGKVLRMHGALGPLQSEAVNGTFTIAMKENDDGTTKLSFLYVLGGYMRYKVSEIAPAIDTVIGEQFNSLATLLGPSIKSEGNSDFFIDESLFDAPKKDADKKDGTSDKESDQDDQKVDLKVER